MKEINPTAVTIENLNGVGGGGANTATGVGPTGEDGKTIEAGEEGGEEGSMSGGKAVPVALMKAANQRRREDEDQRGASGPTGGDALEVASPC